MTETNGAIRIERRFQGPTGSGQGGWTAQRFAERIGEPVSIALRAPTPLETDLTVVGDGDGRWLLVDPAGSTIMIAERLHTELPDTEPVSIEAAAAARARFDDLVTEHPAPACFSCGIGPDTMHVHAGPLDDGRFATDWTAPQWGARPDGSVDPGIVWAAIDCTAAWWVGFSREPRPAMTAQLAAEVITPVEPGATYAIVAWSGGHDPEWDGRKRWAASAAFDATGRCVARSTSFWVSIG
jgi:hypothetical protein